MELAAGALGCRAAPQVKCGAIGAGGAWISQAATLSLPGALA